MLSAPDKFRVMTKVEEIKCFCISQTFQTENGTSVFCGNIYAPSFEEAEKLCRQIGAKLDGELVEAQCANCGKVEEPQKPEIWVDVIEDL